MFSQIITEITTTDGNSAWIAPTIAGGFAVVTALFAAYTANRNRRKGNLEQRAPDVQEIWVQQENDRRQRQIMEDMWWDLRAAFKSYFRRVSSTLLRLNVSDEDAKMFSLTASETAAINATPPSDSATPTETDK
jgi:hypothetical protein